jgi:hypothetical protein
MTSATTVFKAHLPVTVDLSVTRKDWQAYASWLVSAVVFGRFFDKEADETTFVPLSSKHIDAHIPARVRKPLIRDLVNAGVLECDNVYYFGDFTGRHHGCYIDGGPGKCLCYRLGETHQKARIRPRVITHHELSRKLEAFGQEERDKLTDPVHKLLRNWHDRVEVLPSAIYGEHLLLDKMIDGNRRFTNSPLGRLHSNITNLPRQYRQFIRLDGRELKSCDISTSQPLILAILLRRDFVEIQKGLESSGEERVNPIAAFNNSNDTPFDDFLRDCLSGQVYDRVSKLTGYTRYDVKGLFLAVVYGHPDYMTTVVGEAIRKLYPAVFNAIEARSLRHGYKALPRLMQAMESDVMIKRVAGRLLRELPTMPLLTVHDCVLVPEEYEPVARKVISEEWNDALGVVPNIKTSDFTAPQEARKKTAGKPRRQTGDTSLAC